MFVGLYTNSPTGTQDDESTQEIEGGVDERCSEGYGGGVEYRDSFRCYQYDIDDCVDCHQLDAFGQKMYALFRANLAIFSLLASR